MEDALDSIENKQQVDRVVVVDDTIRGCEVGLKELRDKFKTPEQEKTGPSVVANVLPGYMREQFNLALTVHQDNKEEADDFWGSATLFDYMSPLWRSDVGRDVKLSGMSENFKNLNSRALNNKEITQQYFQKS